MIKRSASGLLDRLAATIRAQYDSDRRQHPERFTTEPDGLAPTHLFVDNVARMLGCNVDYVRRIPRGTLPASKVGARLTYARADVEAYISGQRNRGAGRYVAPRGTPTKSPREKSQPVANSFDPIVAVRNALKSDKP